MCWNKLESQIQICGESIITVSVPPDIDLNGNKNFIPQTRANVVTPHS
jgi:hypothetical protein